MMGASAVDIITSNDETEVAGKFKSDEGAVVLLSAMGAFLERQGLVLDFQCAATILELMRTTYFLGYKRGKREESFPGFVVPED